MVMVLCAKLWNWLTHPWSKDLSDESLNSTPFYFNFSNYKFIDILWANFDSWCRLLMFRGHALSFLIYYKFINNAFIFYPSFDFQKIAHFCMSTFYPFLNYPLMKVKNNSKISFIWKVGVSKFPNLCVQLLGQCFKLT